MARWSSTSWRRPHWLGAGAAGLVLAAVLAGCATPSVSSGPDGGTAGRDASSNEQVIVCDSGVVDDHGVKTSSSVAIRVPAGTPVPPGCRIT